MSQVTLYGPPQSSYVRTARMTLHEKGVDYELRPVKLGSDDHRALHPYAKVPILDHGDVRIWETNAIARYVDDAFDGPPLTPATPAARAKMEQWISALDCYMYDAGVRNYALQYIVPRGADGTPNRAVIDESIPKLTRDLELLDAAYADSEWIAGDALSLGDLFVAPYVQTVAMFPEAAAVLERCRNLSRAFAALQARDSYARATPPRPAP
jgi:glutathione S-transferase